MSDDASDVRTVLPEVTPELVRRLMRKQAGLSLRVAAVFVVLLVGLPLFNLYAPDIAATPVYGFTLTWLLLGIVFFPITWLLSALFVSKSDALESEITASEKDRSPQVAPVETPKS